MAALKRAERLPKWEGPPEPFPPNKAWFAPSNSFRKVRRLPLDTIVIHATAGGSSSGAMSVAHAGKASWHALVPAKTEKEHGQTLWRCVPDTGAAWHVLSSIKHPIDGKTNINDRSFGIEIVNRQDGKDLFSDWQLQITALWVRYCWSHYGLKYMYTHAYLDPGRKSDPGHLFDWNKFMKLVLDQGNAVRPPLIIKPEPAGNTNDIVSEGMMVDGSLYAPVRKVAEALGGFVYWDEATRKATLLKADSSGNVVQLEFKGDLGNTMLIDGVLYGPVRKVAEALGGTVNWNATQAKAYLVRSVI